MTILESKLNKLFGKSLVEDVLSKQQDKFPPEPQHVPPRNTQTNDISMNSAGGSNVDNTPKSTIKDEPLEPEGQADPLKEPEIDATRPGETIPDESGEMNNPGGTEDMPNDNAMKMQTEPSKLLHTPINTILNNWSTLTELIGNKLTDEGNKAAWENLHNALKKCQELATALVNEAMKSGGNEINPPRLDESPLKAPPPEQPKTQEEPVGAGVPNLAGTPLNLG